jgi:hypothetical protein
MKIFAIGLSKTGITSLGAALSSLGYRVKKFPLSFDEIRQFDAATDSPIALWFQELDLHFPGSKFIYTTRSKTDWFGSCEAMWRRQESYFGDSAFISAIHQALFSTTVFSRDAFSMAYDRHDERVRNYFINRPNDLLNLNIDDPTKWERMCHFLGKRIPDFPWPHENSSEIIKQLALHLLRVTRDINLVTELTGIIARDLQEMTGQVDQPFDELILTSDCGWEIQKFAVCALRKFGSLEIAARECGISVKTLECLSNAP